MRLLTHNYLQSNVKGTTKGYPLIIQPTKVVWMDSLPNSSSSGTSTSNNPDLDNLTRCMSTNGNDDDDLQYVIDVLSRIIHKIDYVVLRQAYQQVIDTVQQSSSSSSSTSNNDSDENNDNNNKSNDEATNNHNLVTVEVEQEVVAAERSKTIQEQQGEEEEGLPLQNLPKQLPIEIPNLLLKQQHQQEHDQESYHAKVVERDSNSTDDDADTRIISTTTASYIYDIYRALFDVHIMDGMLICPDTQRQFIIKDGIPNMILHEDEI